MSSLRPCELPADALLRRYAKEADDGRLAYVDCYTTEIGRACTLADFVFAFYSTPLFKLERVILRWLAGKPSTDQDARDLADGKKDAFAAWTVEDRSASQLLLSDFRGRTRSWLMVASAAPEGAPVMRLFFGSAVVPVQNRRTGRSKQGAIFRLALPLHKLYSRALLRSARSRLTKASQ